jgi:mycothiol system anti-sigma-R factor
MSKHKCDRALAEIYTYVDQEMTWWRRLTIKRHLSACSYCPQAYEFEQRLRIVVRQRLGEEIPPEAMDRLRDMLAKERGTA